MKRIVFLDIETSGLDPNYHEPIEVGMVTDDPDAGYMEVEFSLAFDASRASPEALEINGFGQRQLAPLQSDRDAGAILMRWFGWDEIPDEEATDAEGPGADTVHVWIKQNPVILVANHVAFDASFLAAWMRRQNLPVPWGKHAWDLPSLMAGRLGLAPPVSTGDIIRHFKVEPMRRGDQKFHSALEDARWNREVYRQLGLWHGVS